MTRLTRTMKVCLALVAMAALPACSLINAPEVLPPEPYDGGADGGPVDGEVEGDADIDADGGPRDDASRPLHEICFNGEDVDDDGDGATDCADLDCASEPTCCGGAGTARLSEDWTDPTNFSLRWLLADLSDYGVVTTQDGVALSSFGDDGVLRSLLPSTPRNRCVSLGFGARIAVTLLPAGCMGCTGEAAVVLTGATTPARGVPLAADLRVAVAADGALRVTSGDTVLSDTSTVDSTGHIVIEIGAAVRDGVPVLAASVSTGATGVEESVIKGIPFIAQSLLSACKDGPGLSIALEGSGSAVTVGAVQVTELACTNPRVFGRDVADTVITSAVLPSTVGWTGGGLSAPALLPEATVQHLFYDATNVPRELESIAPIDFAIGAADALSFASPWGSFSGHALQQGDAYLGTTPPACTSPPCAAQRSVREPTASAVYSGTRIASTEDTHILAFARETDTADLYAIEYVDAPLVNTTPATAPDGMHVLVAPSGECHSVRDPALAQADAAPDAGLWLFYTCEHLDGPSTIRAVALHFDTGVLVPNPETDVEVLGPGIGAYAAHGVAGPAALVRVTSGTLPTLAVRLWFVARGVDGRRSLALAEGQVPVTAGAVAATLPIPALQAYPANPLLYGDSAPLPDCGGTCILRDVAIGRLPNSTALTVLVARSVDLTAGGTEWQLIPLSQTLEQRWWGTP